MLAAPLPQTGVAPRAPSCARWRAARPNPQPHARGAPVVTPASATQVYWSRLALDIVPAATSRWNAESQNSVPACTFSAPYLRARVRRPRRARRGSRPVLADLYWWRQHSGRGGQAM